MIKAINFGKNVALNGIKNTSILAEICSHKLRDIEEFNSFFDVLPKVDFAIRQAKEHFSTNIDELIDTNDSDDTKKGDLGSNLPDLFDLLREIKY